MRGARERMRELMSQQPRDMAEGALINVRKLVALDMVLHGTIFVVAEFAVTVLLGGAGGLFVMYAGLALGHGRVPFVIVFGAYLLLVGVNYVPLLLYAIAIARRDSAREEVARELADKDRSVRKYSLQQFLLLVPLSIPILAIAQELRKWTREG